MSPTQANVALAYSHRSFTMADKVNLGISADNKAITAITATE